MTARDEALDRAAEHLVTGVRLRDSLTVEEAARRAHHAGGPSIPELEALIRAQRTQSPASSPAPRGTTGRAS